MENLVSSWSHLRSLPENYVFPEGKRPGNAIVPLGKTIPLIDLECDDRASLIQQISKACKEFGFFLVINHGVSQDLMDETLSVTEEFHKMPAEDKAREASRDPKKRCKLYTSSENYATEKVHYWRDGWVQPCRPLEECMQFWPQKPPSYREVVERYTVEVEKLSARILELIAEGLGLEKSYFRQISQDPFLIVNHYPPCPDPTLTLGLAPHRDPNIITLVLQGHVHGLEVLVDDKWLGVEPKPHAFVVNTGYILQVISNGKIRGATHRVVTNSKVARTTTSFFVNPTGDTLIGPSKALTGDVNRSSIYKTFMFNEFRNVFLSTSGNENAVDEYIRCSYNDNI